jgi:hypothetical protein
VSWRLLHDFLLPYLVARQTRANWPPGRTLPAGDPGRSWRPSSILENRHSQEQAPASLLRIWPSPVATAAGLISENMELLASYSALEEQRNGEWRYLELLQVTVGSQPTYSCVRYQVGREQGSVPPS